MKKHVHEWILMVDDMEVCFICGEWRCPDCGSTGEEKKEGIAEGLRMAAEMIGGIYKCEGVKKLILAKAKEFEEARGGN